jgi:hypothetical protein
LTPAIVSRSVCQNLMLHPGSLKICRQHWKKIYMKKLYRNFGLRVNILIRLVLGVIFCCLFCERAREIEHGQRAIEMFGALPECTVWHEISAHWRWTYVVPCRYQFADFLHRTAGEGAPDAVWMRGGNPSFSRGLMPLFFTSYVVRRCIGGSVKFRSLRLVWLQASTCKPVSHTFLATLSLQDACSQDHFFCLASW